MNSVEVINGPAATLGDGTAPVVVVAQDAVETISIAEQGPPGPQGPLGPPGPASEIPGPEGPAGTSILYGTTPPNSSIGNDGDFYINTTNHFLYGPKFSGAWPAGTSLIGPTGPAGADGFGSAGSSLPLMDGTATVGVAVSFARDDHRHPTDTSRAPLASPTFTGDPRAPTAAPGDSDSSIATTAFVAAALAGYTGGSTVYVGDTPPPGVSDNSLWWESDSGNLYIKYNDGTTSQWVAAVPPAGVGVFEPIIAGGTTAQYWRGDKSWQTLNKTAVGLGNVDNTADTAKPVSTAQQTALNLKADLAGPTFTGDPKAPTPTAGDNDTSIATTAFVAAAIAAAAGAPPIPQGRLTLTTGNPVNPASVSGAATIYYTPYNGLYVPLYNGTILVPTSIVAQLSNVLTNTANNPAAAAANSVYDLFVWNDAGTMRLVRGPAWTNTTTRSAGTALVRTLGVWLNNAAITNGPAASRGTYVGTFYTNASAQIDWLHGTATNPVTQSRLQYWNAYNRLRFIGGMQDAHSTTAYASTAGPRALLADTNNSIVFVRGLDEDSMSFRTQARSQVGSNAFWILSHGLDSNTVLTGGAGTGCFGVNGVAAMGTNTGAVDGNIISELDVYQALGAHTVYATEQYSGTQNVLFQGYHMMRVDMMY